jgi:Tfp pilus assembly protein PilX
MKYIFHSNEKGSTLIISVLILLLLTVIGIAATNTSTIEILISGNDKVHKMAFHQADGGTEVGIELVEQNIYAAGFNAADLANLGDVNATNAKLYMNSNPGTPPFAAYDANYEGNGTQTNLRVGGNPELSTGSAIQMAAGYEGIGKGAAGSGGFIVYDIWSQHIGVANSEDMILLQWMHVM